MKIRDLQPAGYNPRKISAKQLSALKKSMAEFGDLSGIVVNIRTGNMIGGHQRIKNLDPEWAIVKKAAKDDTGTVATGHIETPWGRWTYREVDWDQVKEKAANLAANKHGGEWDLPKLEIVLDELKELDFDLELTGFELKDAESDGNAESMVPEKDPNILVRLSFHPGLWLGKRDEIKGILDKMAATYECTIKVEE